jgi:hypothetical protein
MRSSPTSPAASAGDGVSTKKGAPRALRRVGLHPAPRRLISTLPSTRTARSVGSRSRFRSHPCSSPRTARRSTSSSGCTRRSRISTARQHVRNHHARRTFRTCLAASTLCHATPSPSRATTARSRSGTAASGRTKRTSGTSGSSPARACRRSLPVAYAALSMQQHVAAQEFAASWFGGGLVPLRHLKYGDKTIPPAEAEAIKLRYKLAVENGDPLVTGKDWEYKPVEAAGAGELHRRDAVQRRRDVPLLRRAGRPDRRRTCPILDHLREHHPAQPAAARHEPRAPAIIRREKALSRLLPATAS